MIIQRRSQTRSLLIVVNGRCISKSCDVCSVFGDIEGDTEKVINMCSFIDNNKGKGAVCLGDFFNNLSGYSDDRYKSMNNIRLISKYLTNNYQYKKAYPPSDADFYQLMFAFTSLRFIEKDYNAIMCPLKCVAGNSECDLLKDIKYGFLGKDSNNNYIFESENHKWRKAFTFEELLLIYNYLSNCYSIIKLENPESQYQVQDARTTVYFKHSTQLFTDYNQSIIVQSTKSKITYHKSILITGHNKVFAKYMINDLECYSCDTSFFNLDTFRGNTRNYPEEIRGKGNKDERYAIVTYDYIHGFTVSAINGCFYNFPKRVYLDE